MDVKVLIHIRKGLDNDMEYAGKSSIADYAGWCRESAKNYRSAYFAVYIEAAEAIEDQCGNAVERIFWSACNKTDAEDRQEFLPGFLYPEELKEVARTWNAYLAKAAADALTAALDEKPDGEAWEDFCAQVIGGKLRTPSLYQAADILGGTFSTGVPCLVFGEDYRDTGYSVGICPEMMKRIMEHPEDYAIVRVYFEQA